MSPAAPPNLGALVGVVDLRPLTRPVYGPKRPSPFSAPWGTTVDEFNRELYHVGAVRPILEVDLRESDFRVDGYPKQAADGRHLPKSPGVRLTFKASAVEGTPDLTYEIAEFRRWHENVRALALGLEALRKVDRYGITKRGEQYAGFRQLTMGGPDPNHGRELIKALGGAAAALRATHPDTREDGYSDRDFADVQAARAGGA